VGRGIVVGIAIGAATAACFIAPDRPSGNGDGSVDDGGSIDMKAGGDAQGSGSSSCVTDNLNTSPDPCSPWGTPSASNGTVSGTGTALALGLGSGSGAFAQCISGPRRVKSVTVAINQVNPSFAGPDTTFVGVTDEISKRWGLEFAWDNANARTAWSALCINGGGTTNSAWNSVSQRYMQITRGSSIVISLGSAAAGPFSSVGSCANDAAFDSAFVKLRATRGSASTSASTIATFDSIELCE
jgi:hypothetical protein